MCGIVGFVGGHDVGAEEKKRALDAISHRGPDGCGEWHSKNGRAWLGHRRLSIIDPEGGKQPCCNEDETVWITFNGCIYNYLELSQSLRKKGHKFKTHSDTEVIIHCYEEYGEKCLDHLIGMFAFAIWDENRKQLFCARDRVGVKPFYYYYRPGIFAFSSEIKGLLSFDFLSAGPDHNALNEYLIFQTTIGPNTLFQGIKKLLPGNYLILDEKTPAPRVREYWDLDFQMDYDHTEAYFTDRLRFLLEDAVKIRLRSDVPLG
ncbi:MAG: asparagine synthase (glutamine-hydrolyzing), partial [Nitrospiraceae bacterium]|nr:asparagine synthase (glutamine-hydrolyzing) [Nitrospiraceae bacterium]